ncbi:MAG: hypothetical protein IPL25_06940 [Saprospiraceae bacterium]|nr:hypothetical protein [Candidatus Vicinibacter affinis]
MGSSKLLYDFTKGLIIVLSLFNSGECFSQKQGNIWYFGGNSIEPDSLCTGLDFNSGNPVLLNNGAMLSPDGSASYCNSGGELLFYSNGAQVYDRTHHVMQNGDKLGGDIYTQQSVLIVPFVKDTNKYYIFTNDRSSPSDKAATGLHYSIIDMQLSNGNGSVLNPKAVSLLKKNSTHLTGCKHYNGNDFWVITSTEDSCQLIAFQITDVGIKAPIISYLNLSSPPPMNIEISPKGNKIALKAKGINGRYYRYIIDFNSSTGQFSNPYPIFMELGSGTYNSGCSFSPNGDLFYDIEVDTSRKYLLHQYDLKAANIKSSRVLISDFGSKWRFDMQIGPDNKIYIGGFSTTYLDQIAKPNEIGQNCLFKKNYIFLGENKEGILLPNETLFVSGFTNLISTSKNQLFDFSFNHDSNSFTFKAPDSRKYKCMLYSLQGQLLLNNEVEDNSQFNASNIPTGLIIYSIVSGLNVIQTGKVLIY